jgi:hypothetical protein
LGGDTPQLSRRSLARELRNQGRHPGRAGLQSTAPFDPGGARTGAPPSPTITGRRSQQRSKIKKESTFDFGLKPETGLKLDFVKHDAFGLKKSLKAGQQLFLTHRASGIGIRHLLIFNQLFKD